MSLSTSGVDQLFKERPTVCVRPISVFSLKYIVPFRPVKDIIRNAPFGLSPPDSAILLALAHSWCIGLAGPK
jgi:hypothetical protein